MTKRSAIHETFTIERVYDAQPSRVFAAFADQKAKARWFHGPAEWTTSWDRFEFRPGGRESAKSGEPEGTVHAFDAVYWDIVPNQRIVYGYEMHLDDRKISVSLTTVEFEPAGAGTKLIFTEQGVFLDGYDHPGQREGGTRGILEQLGQSLAEAS